MKKLIVRKTLKGSRMYRINEMFDCPYPIELQAELCGGSDAVEEIFLQKEPEAWVEPVQTIQSHHVEELKTVSIVSREVLFRSFADMQDWIPITKYRGAHIDQERMKRYTAPPFFKGLKGRAVSKARQILFRKFTV